MMKRNTFIAIFFVSVLSITSIYQSWHVFHFHRNNAYHATPKENTLENYIGKCLVAEFEFVTRDLPLQAETTSVYNGFPINLALLNVNEFIGYKGSNNDLRAPPVKA